MLELAPFGMRKRDLLWATPLLSLFVLGFFACSTTDPPTQIEVRVDSDYASSEIGAIAVDVTWPGIASAKHLRCGGAHPFSFRIDPVTDHPEVPARVVVRAYGPDGHHLVDSIAEAAFTAHEVHLLPMDLTRSCASVACDEATTSCVDGACRAVGRTSLNAIDPDTAEEPTHNCVEGTFEPPLIADGGADARGDTGADASTDPDSSGDADASDAPNDADAGDAPNDADAGDSATCDDADASAAVLGMFGAIWHPSQVDEIDSFGSTYDCVRAKYDRIRSDGWRYFVLQPYVVNGQLRYNAIWRKSTEDETVSAGDTFADFSAKDSALTSTGWRLKILQPYVDGSDVRYTAVWRPSTDPQTELFGVTSAELQAKYDELHPNGWRVDLLKPYVLGNEVRYSAVWRSGTDAEELMLDVTNSTFVARYNVVYPQGNRVYVFENYRLNGEFFYAITYRPSVEHEHQAYQSGYPAFLSKYQDLWNQGWRLTNLHAF